MAGTFFFGGGGGGEDGGAVVNRQPTPPQICTLGMVKLLKFVNWVLFLGTYFLWFCSHCIVIISMVIVVIFLQFFCSYTISSILLTEPRDSVNTMLKNSPFIP